MNVTWEENVFATLEDLDDEGQERVSSLGTMLTGGMPVSVVHETSDEPELIASGMPAFEELELEIQAPRLA